MYGLEDVDHEARIDHPSDVWVELPFKNAPIVPLRIRQNVCPTRSSRNSSPKREKGCRGKRDNTHSPPWLKTPWIPKTLRPQLSGTDITVAATASFFLLGKDANNGQIRSPLNDLDHSGKIDPWWMDMYDLDDVFWVGSVRHRSCAQACRVGFVWNGSCTTYRYGKNVQNLNRLSR